MNLKTSECQRNSLCDPRRQQPSNLERREPEAGEAHSLATPPAPQASTGRLSSVCTTTKSHVSFQVPWEEVRVWDVESAGA